MNERRVGVEIEFSGITVTQAVGAAAASLKARSEALSPHEYLLYSDRYRDPWRLEVDFDLLKRMSRSEADRPGPFGEAAVEALEMVAAVVVPLELVTPPLPFGDVPDLLPLLDDLAAVGAVGSQQSWVYAFGVHFNPNLVDVSAAAILRHLRSFMCLYDWLRYRDRMDLTRRLTTYADPFPRRYERHVEAVDYEPCLEELMDDYLKYNPTRNRALDLLPLFVHLDAERVLSALDDPRIKPRPTFHYRLPNSRLGDPDWSLLDPWRDWLRVERVAGQEEILDALVAARRQFLEPGRLMAPVREWIAHCETVLQDPALA